MLEIFMLRRLCGWLGDKAREKGHGPVPYQVLLVLLWFGGEISGVILGFVITYVLDPNADGPNWLFVIVLAVSGVGIAVLTTYLIVNALADQRDNLAFEGDRVFNDPEGHFNRDRDDDRFRGDGRTDPNKAPRSDDDRYTTE